MTDADRKRFFAKTKRATEIRMGMATPCLEWQAARTHNGYGKFKINDKMTRAHRAAWEDKHGTIPDGIHALHKCDNPPCVDDEHLFLGTQVDNAKDMVAKSRQASGERNGSRLHPGRLARGDRNGSRLHPERLNPPRGESHWSRAHPESIQRGEKNPSAKLNEERVRIVFRLRDQDLTQQQISDQLGVSRSLICQILSRKVWSHVELQTGEAP